MKNVLFVASECVPFVKTGGLADVVGSLPKYFDKNEFDVRVMVPKYACIPEEWKNKILFIETCEEKPVPELFEKEISLLKEKGVFDVVNGVLVGKPQDEAYYQGYAEILVKVIDNRKLPIVYNVNFGHATPRCALQYGVMAKVDMKQKKISLIPPTA